MYSTFVWRMQLIKKTVVS